MRQVLIAGLAATCLGMGLAATPASAMPAASSPVVSGDHGAITQVQWRRGGGFRGGGWHGGGGYYRGGGWRGGYHRGWGGAALGAGAVGLATGAILGGALASPGYGYGSGYYAPAPVYVEPEATGTVYSGGVGGDEAYCIRRFKSYDPASGTYLGYDGLRHSCP